MRGLLPSALVAASVGAAALALHAAPAAPFLKTCVVIHDVAADRTTPSDRADCATRLPPASTFKIPHALLALETGVVTATSVERWDGTAYPGRPSWQQDQTVVSAIGPSVLWFFQRIAPRVGAGRMHDWLERVHYGNADTSGPVTQYWLNGHLRVSPDEQVAFLRRFYDQSLPIAPAHLAAVQAALIEEPGAVENATGSHPLEAQWRAGLVLSAKTGATQADDGTSVSWLVGRLTADGRHYVFASAAWRLGAQVDALDGARAATAAFVHRGLLTAR
ncbi:MAG: penicillin-binding transpeptidase domain-containing protein [Acidobacteriota bacterium]